MSHWLINLNTFAVDTKKKISQKIKNKNDLELLEVNVKKQSLFVDLPKDIELKIADLTIDQQVMFIY